jgi:hypothetical protein
MDQEDEMEPSEAIIKLKGRKFDIEALAAIGALADLAYQGLVAREKQAPLDGQQSRAKVALEEVFPFLAGDYLHYTVGCVGCSLG